MGKMKDNLKLQDTLRGGINNVGVGVDIESISRFRKKISESPNIFFSKVFTERELEYCHSKIDPAPHLAARYTGKEAVIKAIIA